MTSPRAVVLVVVTAPDLQTARRLARSVLRARLAACVNLVPKIESHYWWQGRLEHGSEVLMLLKTTRRQVKVLEKTLLAQHPYDTAEFLVLPLAGGAQRYLDWVAASVAPPRGTVGRAAKAG